MDKEAYRISLIRRKQAAADASVDKDLLETRLSNLKERAIAALSRHGLTNDEAMEYRGLLMAINFIDAELANLIADGQLAEKEMITNGII